MGRYSCEGIKHTFKLLMTYVFSHVGLCTCVVAYSVAGAFLFVWLENDLEDLTADSTVNMTLVEKLVDKIWTNEVMEKVRRNNVMDKMAQDRLADLVRDLNSTLRAALLDIWNHTEPKPPIGEYDSWLSQACNVLMTVMQENYGPPLEQQWHFISSLFYCVTVITTIGYGHIVPATFWGKMSTIFYAVFGIPLFLLTLSNLGDSMASTFRFAYTRVCCCCVKKKEEIEVSSPSQAETGEPPPYIPHQKYSPKRKKMLISPPISATLHRGNDLPNSPSTGHKGKPGVQTKAPNSSSPSPIYLRSHPMALAPEALEARKLVAECSAYASSNIPGFTADPTDMAYDPQHLEMSRRNNNTNHDYDLIHNTMMLEPPTPSPSTASTSQSTPSSPLSRDAPIEGWSASREAAGLTVSSICGTLGPDVGGSSSSQSTRAASPSLTSPNSSGSPRAESSVTWADEDPNYTIEGKVVPRRPPGKTLVVYNTMSGDALKQQSKIAKRMAAMHRRKHRSGQQEESTMFMDPSTGQTIGGNMIGLEIYPIPPKPEPKDVRVPVPIVLTFVACYVMVGALLFHWLEGWDISDSAYFCFITLSTIGFGDLVPGNTFETGGYEGTLAKIKLVASSLYLLFGLAVLAMSFNLVQEEVVLTVKKIARYIGLMKD